MIQPKELGILESETVFLSKEEKRFNRLRTYEREHFCKMYSNIGEFNSHKEWLIAAYKLLQKKQNKL